MVADVAFEERRVRRNTTPLNRQTLQDGYDFGPKELQFPAPAPRADRVFHSHEVVHFRICVEYAKFRCSLFCQEKFSLPGHVHCALRRPVAQRHHRGEELIIKRQTFLSIAILRVVHRSYELQTICAHVGGIINS